MSNYNYIRIAASSPELRVADVEFNALQMNMMLDVASGQGASIILFPELSLTGYTCGDLFAQSILINKALVSLEKLAVETARCNICAVVGLPVIMEGRLYNCAAFIGQGRIMGLVPKTYLPTRQEFYEQRWFTSGSGIVTPGEIRIGDQTVPISTGLLFTADNLNSCSIGIEICEDLWAVEPPSGSQAIAGATIILNPSASNELLGKRSYRRDLVRLQSARCLAGYVYASSGPGESSTDLVYSGHCLITENGSILAESERFKFDSQVIYADIDLERIQHERLCNSSFATTTPVKCFDSVPFTVVHGIKSKNIPGVLRPNNPMPFVPSDSLERATTCREIFSIQSAGLAKRIRHIGTSTLVIGISGGLDSTLALLVAIHAFDKLGIDRKGIIAITMPGLGTSIRTKSNAEDLVNLTGATLRTIPIKEAIRQHFIDIGHDEKTLDVTYENSQARERTQILMDVANQCGGFVLGTGDLSEAALGWCTFNGDHMSMYHVNIGVPKTLVRYIIEWTAEEEFNGEIARILHDICATPITPELLPVTNDGLIGHLTEDLVGPYELHDYFLYNMLRHGHEPAKIFYLAQHAFAGRYNPETILKWLELFVKRFFSQQFKRSAMPDGPKVGTVALSPRGDWRMPSDVSASVWLEQIKTLKSG